MELLQWGPSSLQARPLRILTTEAPEDHEVQATENRNIRFPIPLTSDATAPEAAEVRITIIKYSTERIKAEATTATEARTAGMALPADAREALMAEAAEEPPDTIIRAMQIRVPLQLTTVRAEAAEDMRVIARMPGQLQGQAAQAIKAFAISEYPKAE